MSEPKDNADDGDEAIGGSLPQESVEDRPDVSIVRPEDYPEEDRAKGA
jgi:hypothetical protein